MLRKFLRKKVIIGILVTLAMLTAVGVNYAVGVDGPELTKLSLEEAVELALKNNHDIELARIDLEKADTAYESAREAARDIPTDSVQTYEYGLLKWISPKAAEVAFKLAEKGQEVTRKSIKFSVESAYYNVLKAEKNLAIARDGLKYFQDQLKIAQTAYKIGTKAKVDVTTVDAAVAGYQAQVAQADNTYRTAVMELNRIIGLDLDTPLTLTSKFAVDKTGEAIDLEETIKTALEDNLEILSARQSAELAQVQYDVANKFYGGGVATYDNAKYAAQSAEVKVRKQELATKSAIKQSYLTLFSLEKMIEWQSKEVEAAKENARIFILKYEAGLATSLDVKKATMDLDQAEQKLSESIYQYNLMKSRFKYQLFTTGGAGAGA